MAEIPHSWHHQPSHRFISNSMYMITCGTLHKEHIFRPDDRILIIQNALFEIIEAYQWRLEAWAIFSNHYHIIAQSPDDAKNLKSMIQRLHSQTSRQINKLENKPGRQVWFQYRDTCLSYENSYYARLNYVHNNPVKHLNLKNPEDYPYCSARWFLENAESSFIRKVQSFNYERIAIDDDF